MTNMKLVTNTGDPRDAIIYEAWICGSVCF